MNAKKFRFLVLLVTILALILTACGGGEEEPEATTAPAATDEPAATEPPAATATTAPTNTPEPTATPAPTNTPEPTATADVLAGFQQVTSEISGITIGYPGDWASSVEEGSGEIRMASSEELLTSDDLDLGAFSGSFAVAIGFDAETAALMAGGGDATDPVALLTVFQGVITADTEDATFTQTQEPTAVEVNGMSAATMAFAVEGSDTDGVMHMGLIMGENQIGILIAAAEESVAEGLPAIFDAMLASIEFSEPVLPDLPTTTGLDSQGFLLYGDSVEGTLTADAPAVWDFIGLEGEVVDITVEPVDFDVVVDVLDADGVSILPNGPVDNSFDTETIEALAIATSGPYYISITGFAGAVGDYTLTIVQSGTGTTTVSGETSGSLAYGDTVAGAVASSDESSLWSFEAAGGDVVNITVDPDDQLDAVVDVLDASGNSILDSGEVDNSFDVEEILDLVIPADGTYTVAIRGFAGGTGNFELTLESSGSGSTGSTGTTSGSTEYGATTTGEITSADASLISFRGFANDVVELTVSPAGDLDVVVDVLDANGESVMFLGSDYDRSFGEEYIPAVWLPEDGEYFVAVKGFAGATGQYDVTVDLAFDGVPGSFIFASDSLTEDATEDFFRFTANVGEVVHLFVSPLDGLDVAIDVYNDDTDELAQETTDATFGVENAAFEVTEDGNYYFSVFGFDGALGDYDAIFYGSDFVILELAYGDGVVGRIGEEYIEYAFYGEAGDEVIFSLETQDDIDMVMQILDLDDNVLGESDVEGAGGSESLTFTYDSEGLIIIRVYEFSSQPGDYLLFVD